MKPLDFLIIGAQKCATTTLFEHLRGHPDIAMPLEKEVPFFTDGDCSAQRWQSFSQAQFARADERQLWGKATPQYMSDPRAAARIHELMPQVKLVAILRDPIERTWSHFRMGQRRDTEHRDFNTAIAALLAENGASAARAQTLPDHADGYESEAEFYLAWSEYGRILAEFNRHFDSGQLLVLYTEDLEKDPAGTLDRLLEFIGLPAGYRPASLGEVAHRGGGDKIVPQSVRNWLRERKMFYWLWQQLPEARRGRLRFQYEQWNVRNVDAPMALPTELQQRLRAHFKEDIDTLLSLPLAIAPPPWADGY